MRNSERVYLKDLLHEHGCVEDGTYDLEDIEAYQCNDIVFSKERKQQWCEENPQKKWPGYWRTVEEVQAFIAKHPEAVIANAYDTADVFILSRMPTRTVKRIGTGFSHGSTTILEDCPRRVLVLEQND